MWDKMDEWKQEMDQARAEIPDLEAKVVELKQQLAIEKRKNFAYSLFKGAEGTNETVSHLNWTHFKQNRSIWATNLSLAS